MAKIQNKNTQKTNTAKTNGPTSSSKKVSTKKTSVAALIVKKSAKPAAKKSKTASY